MEALNGPPGNAWVVSGSHARMGLTRRRDGQRVGLGVGRTEYFPSMDRELVRVQTW